MLPSLALLLPSTVSLGFGSWWDKGMLMGTRPIIDQISPARGMGFSSDHYMQARSGNGCSVGAPHKYLA